MTLEQRKFLLLCEKHGLPSPIPEYPFAKEALGRKWRFDFAFISERVAVEQEGGVWMKGGGRHNRGAGMIADMSKYNSAAMLGWRVLRFTPQQIFTFDAIETIKQSLSHREAA